MKSYKRCHLQDEKVSPTLNLPLGVFCRGFYQPLHLTTSVYHWVGHVPQQPALCCGHIPVSPERPQCQNCEIDLCLSLCRQLSSVDPAINWCLVRQAGSQVLLSHVGKRDRHFSSSSLWAGVCQDHQHFSADAQSRPSISHPLKALQHVEVCDDAERHRIPRQV